MVSDNLVWHPSDFTPPEWQSVCETLPQSLEKASKKWPERPAIAMDDQTWSYADLASRAAGIASQIEAAAHAPGPIALVQSVGFDAIASWFACALAGRAFLLLEPDHPTTRLCQLIETAGCSLVLCDQGTEASLSGLPNLNLLLPDDSHAVLQGDRGLKAIDPSMIFPTSGSTGTPKLVTYSAITLQAKAQSSKRLMQVPEGARVVIAGSHGNYGFLHHAFVFLLSGGTLCLADLKTGGFGAVLRAIEFNGALHARFTPSMFRKLAALPQASAALRKLDAVRFSGEPLLSSDLQLAQSSLKPESLIQNVYGSTESALFIWSSSDSQAPSSAGLTVPMGRLYPLASWAIVPLRDNEKDTCTGELVIRSAFHALGDFQDGQIDQTRFPLWHVNSHERLYFTGDIVRSQPDGYLIHLGRSGRMVKLRGHRVFLAEIEQHLRALHGVTEAVVIERVEDGSSVLYGFITADTGQPLRLDPCKQLAERLPDYMVPRTVLEVPHIHLLPGGKVDHQKLVAQLPEWKNDELDKQPTNEDACRLIEVWDSVLWPGAHTHDSDFLALGGDSLKLMALSLEIERVFGRSMPLDDFLADSTLHNLAALLDIEWGISAEPEHKGLRFRRVWPGRQPSKGIALAMPGWNGKAVAVPFGRAGLFRDYDLWAADFDFDGGTMRDSQRWWQAAQAIVERIRSGSVPAPQLIFGYSFGGGLAWLVSRLLAGTPQCPRFVVMVDSAPLHRLRSFRPNRAVRALSRIASSKSPITLHIKRTPLSGSSIVAGSTTLWRDSDQINMRINLPTIDHLEMVQRDMLALAADGVQAFLSGQCSEISVHEHVSGLKGSRLHHLLSGQGKPTTQELEKLLDNASVTCLNGDQLLTLMRLNMLHGKQERAPILIETAVRCTPQSRFMQYAQRRLERDTSFLCPSDMPNFLPASLAAVDMALAMPEASTISPAPKPLRLVCLAYDIGCAVLKAHFRRQPAPPNGT